MEQDKNPRCRVSRRSTDELVFNTWGLSTRNSESWAFILFYFHYFISYLEYLYFSAFSNAEGYNDFADKIAWALNFNDTPHIYIYIYIHIVSKVGDLSQGWPEGSLSNSYYTESLGMALLYSLDCSTLPLILTL